MHTARWEGPLLWMERTLVAGALGLAVWCGVIVVQIHETSTLPIPAAQRILPGEEAGGSKAPSTGAWLARLEAPTLSLSATVLEGTDVRTLRRGAGHIADTALPGERGNVGVAGHRDTIFRALRHVRIGDPLVLTTHDEVLGYRVASTTIVDPGDVYVLDPSTQPTLTLVTCYPFTFIGPAPRRYIVRATLVEARPRGAEP